MASNSFGNYFRITTWGESHGKAIGVIIDGCPAGLAITAEEIADEMGRRAPGKAHTSPRNERDKVEILSGIFEGVTTGAPISLLIWNEDKKAEHYAPIKDLMRPGHANFTYLEKYGCFDYSGGGRASARETAGRVAAGAIAKKMASGIQITAQLKQVGKLIARDLEKGERPNQTDLFWVDERSRVELKDLLTSLEQEGDSIGGTVQLSIFGLPAGLGDPIYEKIEARLACAMLSLPASKGFEIGMGFKVAEMRGSAHNDSFIRDADEKIRPGSNSAGGTLAGISTGAPLICRVAFKPTSSIKMAQKTVALNGESALFQLPEGSRHDPCVAIRAVPIVEAMGALVVADLLLANRLSRV